MMDATGSMGHHIAAVKEQIEDIASRLRKSHQRLSLCVGLIAYRDCGEPMDVLPFTSDLVGFKRFLSTVVAYGGGPVGLADIPGALSRAAHLNWSTNDALTRVLIHIGDAPCHGVKYHAAEIPENFPQGDPSGLQSQPLLRTLRELNVSYFFGKINHSTDQMIKVGFNLW
jgi:hypothetical protein